MEFPLDKSSYAQGTGAASAALFVLGQNAGVSVETDRLISAKPTSAQEEQFERSLRPGSLAEAHYGLGLNYRLTSEWDVRAEFERIRDSRIDFFWLGNLGRVTPVTLFFCQSSRLTAAVLGGFFHQYEDERSDA